VAQQPLAGHLGGRVPDRDFEEGGGPLALVGLGSGVPPALQRRALFVRQDKQWHRGPPCQHDGAGRKSYLRLMLARTYLIVKVHKSRAVPAKSIHPLCGYPVD